MCCSVSPNIEVRFSDTILYAAEAVNLQGKTVHVLGYQNQAQNNVKGFNSVNYQPFQPTGFWDKLRKLFASDSPKGISAKVEESTGNAMILPFPCAAATMSKDNVLDTKNCPDILKDIAKAVKPPPRQMVGFAAQSYRPLAAAVQIFEAAGIYTVVLAQDARDIPAALNQVPKEKRPKLNPELFKAYAKWYPGWTVALCCFNNEELKEALPLLWWYEPMNPEKLFLPALDCHTGNVPKLDSQVIVDHTVAVGSCFTEKGCEPFEQSAFIRCGQCKNQNPPDMIFCLSCGNSISPGKVIALNEYKPVFYSHKNIIPAQMKPYLLEQVMGGVYDKIMPNGDFVCYIDEVRKGIWNPVRSLPPNAV